MDKTIEKPEYLHTLVAGILPTDSNYELFTKDRKSRKMFFATKGSVKTFKFLPHKIRIQLEKLLLDDSQAMEDLGKLKWSEALEEYAFCNFGAADSEPDFNSEGVMQKPDNFRCGDNCRCLKWKSKNINYHGTKLTIREINVLDELKSGRPNKQSADILCMALSTFNTHKKNIMRKLKAENAIAAVFNAASQKIIQ